MSKNNLIYLFCFLTTHCSAIEYYVPGDTLWVWAKGGLNVREKPDARSKILAKISNGEYVTTLDYQDRSLPYAMEEIKKISSAGTEIKDLFLPSFELAGYWAKIKYGGSTGFVFDAYLSRLPTIIGHQYDKPIKEDFHVLALKKHSKVLKQIGDNTYDEEGYKSMRCIFDIGCIIDISSGSRNWGKEMLFSNNLSLIEGYLIYGHTMKGEKDKLLEKGEDYLIFQVDTGTLTIKKAGPFLVIYEEHRC